MLILKLVCHFTCFCRNLIQEITNTEGKATKVTYICHDKGVAWNLVEFKEMFNPISSLQFIFILNNNENADIHQLGKPFFIF